jgi:aminoglycoside/choline kinase family phosphotransferase
MKERNELKLNFLKSANLLGYELNPIPADASFRTYDRVKIKDKNLILMNSPPEHYSLTPFIEIAELLRKHNLPAPEIFHIDSDNGFMLLEDFGGTSVKDFVLQSPHMQRDIYKKIIELLVDIQKVGAMHLAHHTTEVMLSGLEVFADWYAPFKTGAEMTEVAKEEYLEKWRNILNKLPNEGRVLSLRDFHIENLMHRGDSIGLLDFQDATLGSPAYDLVSLLEDARCDVPLELAQEMIDYYLSLSLGLDREEFMQAYSILGAQRNSRILGYFARKAKRDGATKYLEFIPRTLKYLERDLSHPVFASFGLDSLHSDLI